MATNMLQAQIFIYKHELVGTQTLYEFILQLLIKQNINGATVFEGSLGYGINQRINKPNALFSFDETPMSVVFVDSELKVKHALKALRNVWKGGLIVTSTVELFNDDDDSAANNSILK